MSLYCDKKRKPNSKNQISNSTDEREKKFGEIKWDY